MDDLTRFQMRKYPGLTGESKGAFALLYAMTGMTPGMLDDVRVKELAERYGCTSASMLRYLRKLKDFRLIDLERVRHGVWRIFVYHPSPEKRAEKPTPLFDWAENSGQCAVDSGQKNTAHCSLSTVHSSLPKEPEMKTREGETVGQAFARYDREMKAYKAAQNQKISDPLYISIDSIETVDHLTSIEAFQNPEVEVSEQREVKPQSHGSAKTMQSTFSEMGFQASDSRLQTSGFASDTTPEA